MGQVSEAVINFLISGGRDLGFDENCCPKINEFKTILKERVPVWHYYGYQSEEEYYDAMFDDNEPIEY